MIFLVGVRCREPRAGRQGSDKTKTTGRHRTTVSSSESTARAQVVVCTQPRRVAAITLAEYVAKDRGQETDVARVEIRKLSKANICFSDAFRI